MLSRKQSQLDQKGFSLVELLVVILLVAVVFATFTSFFNNYLILYSKYQQDGMAYSELSQQSQRISDVVRGLTDIDTAADNEMIIYAYFSPTDTYVSQVHYYLINSNKTLMVDVTPMTANPPNGTLITASKKTYKIIEDFYLPTGGKIFTYYDAGGTVLSAPVADKNTVLSIKVDITTPSSKNPNGQSLSTTVSLRNRKTNL